jgi:hypothetical protein
VDCVVSERGDREGGFLFGIEGRIFEPFLPVASVHFEASIREHQVTGVGRLSPLIY